MLLKIIVFTMFIQGRIDSYVSPDVCVPAVGQVLTYSVNTLTHTHTQTITQTRTLTPFTLTHTSQLHIDTSHMSISSHHNITAQACLFSFAVSECARQHPGHTQLLYTWNVT